MLGILTVLALIPSASAAAPADGYEFLPDTIRLVQMSRPGGNWGSYILGCLDDTGNFVPPVGNAGYFGAPAGNPKPTPGPPRSLWVKAGAGYSGPGADIFLTRNDFATAYEYRSGVLILGRYDDTWTFVPDIGSTVIELRDYLKDYREGGVPPIYNLPGRLHKKGTPVPLTELQKNASFYEQLYKKAMADLGIANPPPLPPPVYYPNYRPLFLDYPAVAREAVTPAAPAPVPPGVYEFVLDTERRVELRRRYGHREYWYIGTLDAAGAFEFDGNYLHCFGSKPEGTPETVLLNREDLGPCYEYRSGRLIKGKIDEKLNFVPEIGSKVIDFKDYKYAPGALPIWNLPGYFKKK